MDIDKNINSQKTAIDLSQLPLRKHAPGSQPAPSKGAGNEFSANAPIDASTVSLSQAGREASVTVDFNATEFNLSKLDALASSKSFAKPHATISYEKIKNLLP